MSRYSAMALVVLTSATVWAGSTLTLLNENFESGLGAWTAESNLGPNDDTPLIFDADGNGPDGAVVYGPKTPYVGMPAASKTAGYSSDLTPGWDGSSPQWIEKEWHLAPGTYDIQLSFDRYLYYGGSSDDFWALGNRAYLLTNDDYALDRRQWARQGTTPGFDSNNPDVISTASFRRTRWRGDSSGAFNGAWEHVFVDRPATVTTTGNFVLRLLMHEKYAGQQSILWDNVVLSIKQNGVEVAGFPFSEGFEDGLAANGWVAWSPYLLGNNDTPSLFTFNDPLLYTNTGNPGSHSAGYSSNIDPVDTTSGEWLQWQKPAAVVPGTYAFRLEFDRYVYTADQLNPWGLGNRVCLLTDNLYNTPGWNFDGPGPFLPSFRWDYWPGDGAWALNGTWHHEVIDDTLTTTTGNIELRLLRHEKITDMQAVAWDNVKLTVVLPCNDPWADANGDTFVDMVDFAILQTCLTKGLETQGPLALECKCFDRGTIGGGPDGQVGDADVTEFIKCVTGPQIPWVKPADCTNP
jgi:hypothetical protein